MPELRWILIGFAIVLMAAIYLWGRRTSAPGTRREPVLDVTSGDAVEAQAPAGEEPHVGMSDDDAQDREAPEGHEPHVATPLIANTGAYPRTIVRENQAQPAPLDRGARAGWRGRIEPTLSDPIETEERLDTQQQDESLPEEQAASEGEPAGATPLHEGTETPTSATIEYQKILALRLAAAPHRYDGARLLEAFASESLQYGKYHIFHRLHDDGTSIFSVANMVEPGTFELESMGNTQYRGLTLFAQLPGPLSSIHALNELVACARRLQERLGGTLQDDRGAPLTVYRIEQMRQEVREFERTHSRATSRG